MAPVGQLMPSLDFIGADGKPVSLASVMGAATIVLYFYAKDDTPGCTVEACSFRDAYEAFKHAGAEVIGVSSDGTESHDAFKAKNRLPFQLWTDPDGRAARALGVKKMMGFFPGRVTFVIDRQGIVRMRFDSAMRFKKHAEQALELVRSLEQR